MNYMPWNYTGIVKTCFDLLLINREIKGKLQTLCSLPFSKLDREHNILRADGSFNRKLLDLLFAEWLSTDSSYFSIFCFLNDSIKHFLTEMVINMCTDLTSHRPKKIMTCITLLLISKVMSVWYSIHTPKQTQHYI